MRGDIASVKSADMQKCLDNLGERVALWGMSTCVKLSTSEPNVVEVSIMPNEKSRKSIDLPMLAGLHSIACDNRAIILRSNWLFGSPGHLEMQICECAGSSCAAKHVHGRDCQELARMVGSSALMSDLERCGDAKLAGVEFVRSKLSLDCAKSVRLAVGMWCQREFWTRLTPLENWRDAFRIDSASSESVHMQIPITEASRASTESQMTGGDIGMRQFTVEFGNCQDLVSFGFLVDLVTTCGASEVRLDVHGSSVALAFDESARARDTSADDFVALVDGSAGRTRPNTSKCNSECDDDKSRGIARKALNFAAKSGSAIRKRVRKGWMDYNARVARRRVREFR